MQKRGFSPWCKVQPCQNIAVATPYGETFANGKAETYGISDLHITGKKTLGPAQSVRYTARTCRSPTAWCTETRRFYAPLTVTCDFVDGRNADKHCAVDVIRVQQSLFTASA